MYSRPFSGVGEERPYTGKQLAMVIHVRKIKIFTNDSWSKQPIRSPKKRHVYKTLIIHDQNSLLGHRKNVMRMTNTLLIRILYIKHTNKAWIVSLYANVLLSQLNFARTPEGHVFRGMFLKPLNKLAGRVLSGLKPLGFALSALWSKTR